MSRRSVFIRMAANREFVCKWDRPRNVIVTTEVLSAAVPLHLEAAREIAAELRGLGLECSIANCYGEPVG